jgi:hypothetical protein
VFAAKSVGENGARKEAKAGFGGRRIKKRGLDRSRRRGSASGRRK